MDGSAVLFLERQNCLVINIHVREMLKAIFTQVSLTRNQHYPDSLSAYIWWAFERIKLHAENTQANLDPMLLKALQGVIIWWKIWSLLFALIPFELLLQFQGIVDWNIPFFAYCGFFVIVVIQLYCDSRINPMCALFGVLSYNFCFSIEWGTEPSSAEYNLDYSVCSRTAFQMSAKKLFTLFGSIRCALLNIRVFSQPYRMSLTWLISKQFSWLRRRPVGFMRRIKTEIVIMLKEVKPSKRLHFHEIQRRQLMRTTETLPKCNHIMYKSVALQAFTVIS